MWWIRILIFIFNLIFDFDLQARQVDLENQLGDIRKERDELLAKYEKVENEYSTIRRTHSSKEQEAKKRQSYLEDEIRKMKVENEKLKLVGSGSSSMVRILNTTIIWLKLKTMMQFQISSKWVC